MTANELFTIIAQISGLLGIVCSMLAMGLGLTLTQISATVEKRAPGDPGAAGELCAGASARLRHHADHPARRIAQDRVDRPGHLRGCALPDAGGAGRQGQPGCCCRGDDPPDGGDHFLPARGPAAAPGWRRSGCGGNCPVADRADADPADPGSADQVTLRPTRPKTGRRR